MGKVLVKFNQASSDQQSWTNLKERHMGWSQQARGMWFKREDGSEFGDPVLIPSTIGQGMGRRVSQQGHGFVLGTLVRLTGGQWVRARATATDVSTLASHMVVRVVDPNIFEVASTGAWNIGSAPVGTYYLTDNPGEASTTPTDGVIKQIVAFGDGSSFHLAFATPTSELNLDNLVEDLNDRVDLYALPKGQAGGDLLGQYPNPVVQKLTGLSVTWESMAPKWADTGLPFIPSTYVLAAAWKPNSGRAMLVDNGGYVYFSVDGGYTWKAAGYYVGNSIRDIAYGKISGTTYGWCVIGNNTVQWIADVPENFVNDVPLQSAWVVASLSGSWADICYCEALGAWFFQNQSPGLTYCYELTATLTTHTVTPQGSVDYTGGVFYETSTRRVVYFERGTGRVWWAGAGFTAASGWTEVLLGGVPVLKAISPTTDDAVGFGAGVSTDTIVAFVGGQGVVSTTSVADPTKYTQSIGINQIPNLWDVASNGTELIGSTVANVDPVLFKIHVTLGEIPSEQRVVGKKGFLSQGTMILKGLENAEALGTDEWGTVVKKTASTSGNGKVKVDATGTAGYLEEKLTRATNSPITLTKSGDKLVLDFTEDGLSDPVILTTSLLTETGDVALTGSCWDSTYANGEWGGYGQNTTDLYFKLMPLSRGTVSRATIYITNIHSSDAGVGAGNYGAVRIGLFDENGVLKGQTGWVRGITTFGKLTLAMTAEPGQDLTIQRNTLYWIGIIGRGMNIIANVKAASALNLTTLRHAVKIRSASSGADWSSMATSGTGFVATSVPVIMLSAN